MIAYTLSAFIDGRRQFLNADRNAFILPNVRGCGTYRTFDEANAEATRSRGFMQNNSVEVVTVNT